MRAPYTRAETRAAIRSRRHFNLANRIAAMYRTIPELALLVLILWVVTK